MRTRTAKLVIKFRPRINRVVVLHRGRVVCRTRDLDGAKAFIEGWREVENGKRELGI